MGLRLLEWATALLYNGCGRYGEALDAAQRGCEQDDVGVFGWSLVELIEAGVRSGATDASSAALDRLSGRTQASGTEWALGIEAGSRALLSDGQDRRPSTARRSSGSRALEAWSTSPVPGCYTANGYVARTAARTHASNSEPPTKRSATSGPRGSPSAPVTSSWPRARPRGSAPTTRAACLHPQEAHIARLAKDGLSDPEIGAQLFISPRTVQYHLRKVFLKLDINSRNQLSRVPGEPAHPRLALAPRPATQAGVLADARAPPGAGPSPHDKSPSHQEGGGDAGTGSNGRPVLSFWRWWSFSRSCRVSP